MKNDEISEENDNASVNKTDENIDINVNENKDIDDKKSWKLTKKDVILMLVICLIYAIVSFINLGTLTNPQTFWESKSETASTENIETKEQTDEALFRIAQGNTDISNIRYYVGVVFGTYDLYVSYDGINYADPLTIKTEKVFAWKDYGLVGDFEYFKLVPKYEPGKNERMYLGEIAVYDTNGNKLELIPLNENAKILVDEQDTIPDEISYMNSTIFDEIYFARTAYEHLHNLPIYEWTHPPLGKLIMTIPMVFLGMNTFAYRLMGNIAGILMIAAIYILAKMLFKETKYGVLAAIIMAVDGIHFVQTRLGTSDGFLVLFIILEYLFMYRYILQKDKKFTKRLWPLFFSGFFMGCAIAVKWSGVFAAIGLAAIFLINLIKEFAVEKTLKKADLILTIIVCYWFFVMVPLLIYILSYIPYFIVENAYIKNEQTFIGWQIAMYNYHHDLIATHPYSSQWFTWPLTQQSMLYWIGKTKDAAETRIALIGNPAIFWSSIVCLGFVWIKTLHESIKTKKWFKIILATSLISLCGIIFSIMPQIDRNTIINDTKQYKNFTYEINKELNQDEKNLINQNTDLISNISLILDGNSKDIAGDGQTTKGNVEELKQYVTGIRDNLEQVKSTANLNAENKANLEKSIKMFNRDINKLNTGRIGLYNTLTIICIPFILFTAIASIKLMIQKKEFGLWFIIVPIVAMISAYVGVPRIMFLYHYFPILPFVMLAIVAFIKWLCEKFKNNYAMYVYIIIIVVIFIIFYPVYSGYPTTAENLKGLQWLRTWIW